MAPNYLNIPYNTALPYITSIFEAVGCDKAESERCAKYLLSANITGHDSHGIIRVPRYVASLKAGTVLKAQELTVLSEGPSFAMVSGNFGLGQTVAPLAVQLGIKKAKETGIALIGLREAGHVSRIGDWGEMASEHGLVSIHFVNVGRAELVAPFGGTSKRFSTNPFCVCVPGPAGEPPLLLDFATSLVAEGKVLVASNGGKPIPEKSLITDDGKYSSDPEVLYGPLKPGQPRNPANGTGSMVAFGDHKGSALAFMCDILAGVFIGSPTSGPMPTPPPQATQNAWRTTQYCNGMFSIYLDPSKLGVDSQYVVAAKEFADYVRASHPASAEVNPSGKVYAPGDVEAITRKERLEKGLPITVEVWDSIRAVAEELKVPVPTV